MKEVKTKKSLLNLQSYRPAVAESKSSEIIRLSVNEGALGPSPKVCLAIKNWSKQKHLFHRYPDQIDQNLIKAIASRYGLNKEKIVLGNGSDDLIQLICNTYLDPGDEAIYTEYGFLVFPQSIRIAGGKPIMAKDVNYTASLDNILSKISKKTKIIFLANPNNPTGTMVGGNEISNFIKKVRSNILIILDAAYAEYVDKIEYSNGLEFVEKLNNVIMLRTFSKLHALASLRLGWAYCPEKIANILKSVRPAFSVNSLASFAGTAAVEDVEFQKLSFSHNLKTKKWVFKELKDHNVNFIHSETNFFLLNFYTKEIAIDALRFFEEKNIFVRGMQPYNLSNYLRVTIGTKNEMKIFLECILSFLKDK